MIVSPLRYPGGKAKLYPFFQDLISANELYGAHYCEPYAGGAGLAIRLLVGGFVKSVSLNDIDNAIVCFWKSAIYRSDEFCELIATTPISIEEWYRQREIWRAGDKSEELKLGFATYFLNRTNRSGIIDGAGPIGGYKQDGEWELSARLVKDKQIANIKSLSRYARQISITSLDAMEFVRTKVMDTSAMIYLDPPYFIKGRKLYKNFYKPNDHAAIAEEMVSHRKLKWIVSYDDVPQIRELYSSFCPFSYSLNYSAGKIGLGTEVLYLSDALAPPTAPRFPNAA